MARIDKIIAEYDLKLKAFEKDISKIKKGLKSTETQSKKSAAAVSKNFNGLKSTFATLGVTIGAAFVLRKTIKNIADFEKAIANLSAITGAGGKDLEFYKEKAIEMSSASTLAAKDVVEAFKLVGSAVPELLKSKEALAEVTENAIILSEAANLDLGLAAKALGETLNQFNLDASESARVINELAAASQLGAKEIPFVNDALTKFGGIAEKAGVKTNVSISAIEILGKVIPEASIAGNAMKGILINMQIEAAKAGREFMGLEAELEFYAKDINNVGKLTRIFRQENLLSIQTLIQNRDELTVLSKAITGTNTALEQAAINTNTLAAAWVRLGNGWDNAILQGEGVAPLLGKMINGITEFLRLLTTTGEKEFARNVGFEVDKVVKTFDRGAKETLEILEKQYASMIKGNQQAIDELVAARDKAISNRSKALLAEQIREAEGLKRFGVVALKIVQERLAGIKKAKAEAAAEDPLVPPEPPDPEPEILSIKDLKEKRIELIEAKLTGQKVDNNEIILIDAQIRAIEALNLEIKEEIDLLDERNKLLNEGFEQTKDIEAQLELAKGTEGSSDRLKRDIEAQAELGNKAAEIAKSRTETERDRLDQELDILDQALAKQLIAQEDYAEAVEAINDEITQNNLENLNKIGNEFSSIANSLLQLSENNKEAEIANINETTQKQIDRTNESAERGVITKQQAADAIVAIEKDSASQIATIKADLSAFEITLAFASIVSAEAVAIAEAIKLAVSKAESPIGAVANIVALVATVTSAFISVSDLINQVNTTPTLAKGIIDIDGPGTKTSDSIPVRLSKGESVMTADETSENLDILTAIRNKSLDNIIYQKYTKPLNESVADSMLRSINLQNELDDSRLLKKIGMTNDLSRTNTDRIVKALKPEKLR